MADIYRAWGDSITLGGLVATPYPQGVGAARGWTTYNNAVGNTCVIDAAALIYAQTPVAGETYSIGYGANDSRTYLTDANKKAYFKAGLQALIAWLAAPQIPGTDTTNITYSGSWATDASHNGGIGRNTTASGATATATVIGRTVYVAVPSVVSGDGVFTISIDGVSQGTFTNYEASDITSRVSGTFGSKLLRFPGLSDDVHTVVLTRTSGTVRLDWIGGVIGGNNASVYVMGITRQSPNGYTNNGSSDAIVATYNLLVRQAVHELATDGLNCCCVDVVQVMNNVDNSDIIYGDGTNGYGIHPTQQGTNKMKQALLNAMDPYSRAGERQAVRSVGFLMDKASVTGSRGSNAALASLITALAAKGLITDGTS